MAWGMSGRSGRTRAVLGETHHAKVAREIVVQQPETAAAIRGCMENARMRGLVLSIVPWGIQPDYGRSALLDDADVVSYVATAAIFSLGCIPAWSSRSAELSSKRIWLTSLTNGLIFEGSIVCLFPA